MMPNVVKGSSIVGLLQYLAGPGRANEHENPRVLAGDVVTMAVFGGAIDRARARELGRLLDSPRQTLLRGEPVLVTSYKRARALMDEGMSREAALAAATKDQNTWHCSLSLKAAEGQLPDVVWAGIAQDFMREMGFIDRHDGAPDARWTAIHHGLSKRGNDHIHIAMPIVRSDGSLADVFRDLPRAQAAARVLEKRYGLEVLYTREFGDTERATKPAERARAERVGAPETDREALRRRVRAAALASESEAEFVRELRAAGVVVRPRFAKGGTDEVVGFAVRIPSTSGEKSVWYSGGRLAKDLTLAAMRDWAGWDSSEDALPEWRHGTKLSRTRDIAVDPKRVITDLREWSQRMREIPVDDRAGWAAAASQSAGVFAALSVRTETTPGPLDRLSRQLARAGQQPARRRLAAVKDGRQRSVARMLWMARNPGSADLALVYALTDLLLAVRESLEAAGRAKAAAALASQARKSLTEIHMRAAGVDPSRPHRRDEGSPAWAAAVRSSVVVDQLDRSEYERVIESASRAWEAQRVASIGVGAGCDEKGHILEEEQRHGSVSLVRRPRSRGPATGRGFER